MPKKAIKKSSDASDEKKKDEKPTDDTEESMGLVTGGEMKIGDTVDASQSAKPVPVDVLKGGPLPL